MSKNPEHIFINGEKILFNEFINEFKHLKNINNRSKDYIKTKIKEDVSLKPYQVELLKLQTHLENINGKMIIIFEGRDAAGKGGTIRRVTRFMNEKHYRVVALGKPTEEQRSQWYYQRYVAHFPTGGEIVLFDRSWYNRAMVENVFGFCTTEQYEVFMKGVKGFERDLVRHGITLVKLYFSVTKEEQARRFHRRKHDKLREWKLSEIDLQAQEHWDDFTNCKFEMLKKTHSIYAPWVIIRSDNKPKARLQAIKVILNSIDYENKNPNLDYTVDNNIVVNGDEEIKIMKQQRKELGKFEN